MDDGATLVCCGRRAIVMYKSRFSLSFKFYKREIDSVCFLSFTKSMYESWSESMFRFQN
jgi:hypothetical protein